MAEGQIIPFEPGDGGRRRRGPAGGAGKSHGGGRTRGGEGTSRASRAAGGRPLPHDGEPDDDGPPPDDGEPDDDGEDVPFTDDYAARRGAADHGGPRAGGEDSLRALGEALRAAVTATARLTTGELAGAGRQAYAEWDRRAAAACAFARRRLSGEYPVDDDGFDPELTDVFAAALRPLYQRWFRVEVRGLENVPADGGALVVANHSGTLPWDAIMTQVALHDEHPARRNLRMLAADLVFRYPFLGELARKAGHTLACQADAERLLGSGEIVGVWPEGFKGIGKPFAERYKLQRFGRGGFVSAAMRAGAPIIPTAIVGAEEIYPMLMDAKPLARLFGLPYFPITPTFPWLGPLGLVPLPSRWVISFGAPIPTADFDPGAADDPMLVFNLADEVRESIQESLYRLLMQRKSVFR